MKNAHIDLSQVAAMNVEQLQAVAEPLLAALKAKKAQARKSALREKRKAYERERRLKTVAVNLRLNDAADAQAARALITNLKALAKATDTSFAFQAAVVAGNLTAATAEKPAAVAPTRIEQAAAPSPRRSSEGTGT